MAAECIYSFCYLEVSSGGGFLFVCLFVGFFRLFLYPSDKSELDARPGSAAPLTYIFCSKNSSKYKAKLES